MRLPDANRLLKTGGPYSIATKMGTEGCWQRSTIEHSDNEPMSVNAIAVISRMLKPRANRWANMVAGTIDTAAVLLTTIFLPTLYYLFFGAIGVVVAKLKPRLSELFSGKN
jgi:hypothetical protein